MAFSTAVYGPLTRILLCERGTGGQESSKRAQQFIINVSLCVIAHRLACLLRLDDLRSNAVVAASEGSFQGANLRIWANL